LQYCSDDRLKSTYHRVRLPRPDEYQVSLPPPLSRIIKFHTNMPTLTVTIAFCKDITKEHRSEHVTPREKGVDGVLCVHVCSAQAK